MDLSNKWEEKQHTHNFFVHVTKWSPGQCPECFYSKTQAKGESMLTKTSFRSAKFLIAFIACIFSASCATAPRNEAAIDTTTLKADEGIVIFSVAAQLCRQNGEKITGSEAPKVDYTLRYFDTSRFFGRGGNIDGDTQTPETLFARRLPAGEYKMDKLYASIGTMTANTPIDVHFTVSPNKATYIGSLQLEFRERKGTSNNETQALALKVADNTANATNMFKTFNPALRCDIVTNLMRIAK